MSVVKLHEDNVKLIAFGNVLNCLMDDQQQLCPVKAKFEFSREYHPENSTSTTPETNYPDDISS